MSKQAKGTVNVWLSSGTYTKPSDLHKLDDERLVASVFFQNTDMSRDGWKFWLTLLACVAAFVLMSGCSGPSDLEAERATAAALQVASPHLAERASPLAQAKAAIAKATGATA